MGACVAKSKAHLHGFISERVDNLGGIEILLAISIHLEQLSGTVTQELVVRYLNFKSARIPRVVQVKVTRVDECDLFIYGHGLVCGILITSNSHLEPWQQEYSTSNVSHNISSMKETSTDGE